MSRRAWSSTHRALAVAAVFAVSIPAASCGLFRDEAVPARSAPSRNLLGSGGFEEGSGAWLAATPDVLAPAIVSERFAHSGRHSLELTLDPAAPGSPASSAFHFTTPSVFPEFISGFYLADDWPAHAEGRPYLRVDIAPQETDVHTPPLLLHLAGLQREPTNAEGAGIVMVSRRDVVPGKWTFFSYPVKQAFVERGGALPGQWARIVVRLSIRFDGEVDGTQPVRTYFDDLYFGPQDGNPNRPPGLD